MALRYSLFAYNPNQKKYRHEIIRPTAIIQFFLVKNQG